ncbi:mannosyl-glycoprotein endo-beta-N-acetylglucosaminidase family protein [Streptococcus uberis]|uniref:glycoside hydrolase family 73 protein n=1 Tax=Streptococcus uberis TaxID=1349 RepID=UPI000DA342DF|nr:glycoside hydrolase family 73 protein [Streptococcus uberis]SQG82948.1 mannosyl-glycoprotein endo-beta-N-acetylglucosaminidase family protein [Streptococcus uberis]
MAKNYRKKVRRKPKSSKTFENSIISWILLSLIISVISLKYYQRQLISYHGNESIQFIGKVSHSAQKVAQQKDLYSSVMIAQAILESNNGKSQLSQKPYYNFFGIKGEYKGKSVDLPTLEDDGQGNLFKIDANFRSYGSLTNGFNDYAKVLEDPLYKTTHQSQTRSHKEATATLTGHYATDTSYHEKLNKIIEVYQLTLFDYPF